MRIWTLITASLITAAASAQTAVDLQKKAIESLPAMSFDELQQCVKPGEAPTSVTTKFGTPSSGKSATSFTGSRTISFSWPSAGAYRESHVALEGIKYTKVLNEMNSKMTYSTDGDKSYMLLEDTGRRQIQVTQGRQGTERPIILNELNLSNFVKSFDFKESGSGNDPKFGRLIHLVGKNSTDADVAPERDYITTHMKIGSIEMWLLDAKQFEGHWVPTSVKTRNIYNGTVDTYTTIKNLKPLAETDKKFTPTYTKGTLVIDNNVYYDVTTENKLVKSKMQPDRTSEYLTWAAIGVVFVGILSVIVIGCYKVFRKQPA